MHTEEAGCEETQICFGSVNRTSDSPGKLRGYFIQTPETTVSGVSI